MPDSLFRISLKQLRESEISGYLDTYIATTLSGSILSYLNGSGTLGGSVVYVTGSQVITGIKDFKNSPLVPFSGGTGAAPSRLYIDIQDSGLQNQITPLLTSVNRSGVEYISGTKTLNGVIINTGFVSGNLSVPIPTLTGHAVPLGYLNTQLNAYLNSGVVHTSTDESVSGIKSFFNGGTVYLPTATNFSGGVPLSQLDSTGNYILDKLTQSGYTLQNQIDSIDLTDLGHLTGYAGLAALNGVSGFGFLVGRGNVSVTQNSNVISVSGHTINSYTGIILGYSGLSSGIDKQFIRYNRTFSTSPYVFADLENVSGEPLLSHYISGRTTSGFNIVLSNSTTSNNYFVNYIAYTGTGYVGMLMQGAQGIQGPSGAGAAFTITNVNTNSDKLGLSNIPVGYITRISGEAGRVEQYLTGSIGSNDNWCINGYNTFEVIIDNAGGNILNVYNGGVLNQIANGESDSIGWVRENDWLTYDNATGITGVTFRGVTSIDSITLDRSDKNLLIIASGSSAFKIHPVVKPRGTITIGMDRP